MFRLGIALATTALARQGGGAPPPAPSDTPLVKMVNRSWLDTGSPGETLTALQGWRAGASYTVALQAQATDVQPPADALAISSGNLVRGAGWAGVQPGYYRVLATQAPFLKQSCGLVAIFSNKTANYTPAGPGDLPGIFSAIATLINANPATFPGAVIDLNPAVDWGEINISGLPVANYNGKVILRSASTDRESGAMPRVNRVTLTNARKVMLQSLDLRPTTAGVVAGTPLIGGSGNTASPFFTALNCHGRGGKPVLDGLGGVTLDPNALIDPTDPWDPLHTAFQYQGSPARIVLWNGPRGVFLPGVAEGTGWQALPLSEPAYVGLNAPLGINPLLPFDFTGTGWSAEFEVLNFPDNSPVVSPATSQSFTKPADGPPGRYITAVRYIALGTTNFNSNKQTLRLYWAGQVGYAGASGGPTAVPLPFFFRSSVSSTFPNAIIARCRIESMSAGIDLGVSSLDDTPWTFENYLDGISADFRRVTFQRHPTVNQIWEYAWNRGDYSGFNHYGRSHTRQEGNWGDIHKDGDQAFRTASGGGNPGLSRPRLHRIGDLMFRADGVGSYQGRFASDLENQEGYYVYEKACFYRPGMSNVNPIDATILEQSFRTVAIQNFGSGGAYPTDTVNVPAAVVREKCLAVLFRTLGALPSNQRRLTTRTFTQGGTDAAVFANPNYGPLSATTLSGQFAEMQARFAPIGAAVGEGPFGDLDDADHAYAAWDPNDPWFPLFPDVVNVPISTSVRTKARQLPHGAMRYALTEFTNCRWQKGATAAAAEAASPQTGDTTIEPGEFLVIEATSAAFNTTTIRPSFKVNGIVNQALVRTEVGPVLGPPEPGDYPTLVGVTTSTTGNSSIDPITPIRLPSPSPAPVDFDTSPVALQPGETLLAFVLVDGNTSAPLDETYSTAGWVEMLNNPWADRIMVWRLTNETGAAINAALRFDLAAGEQYVAHRYIIRPTTPGYRLNFALISATATSGTNINLPSVDMPGNFKALLLLAAGGDGRMGALAAPDASYTTPIANLSGTSSANNVRMTSWRKQVQSNTEDPGAVTWPTSHGNFGALVAAWEEPL
jgi:hypothetical protein